MQYIGKDWEETKEIVKLEISDRWYIKVRNTREADNDTYNATITKRIWAEERTTNGGWHTGIKWAKPGKR